ncbi:MAG: hypothetical protein WA117_14260 [Verrucomicrobiia bacterium]
MDFFVCHPERISAVVGVLFVIYLWMEWRRRFRAFPLLVASVVWGIFVCWEGYAKEMKYNIRVDLLLIFPVLAVVTIWGFVAGFRPRR